ncbi:unnamed protein product, partial [Rotaria sp. Silwood1]
YVQQGLIVTTFSSSCSTIRTSTITSFTSIISLPVSSKINENNSTINEQQLILYWLLVMILFAYSSSYTNANIEQERYCDAVVELTPRKILFFV